MTQTDTDLLVVGAGPSGSIAAFHAARAGLDVTIVDKTSLPRVKPCAGGVATKALLRLPFSISSQVERSTNVLMIGRQGRKAHRLEAPGVICAFVDRPRFDRFLLDQAEDAGAQFQLIDKLTAVTEGETGVTIETASGAIRARYVIAADGANSTLRRLVMPGTPLSRGFAVEGKVPLDPDRPVPEMELVFDRVQEGYAWIFPKRDHANVGLYTMRTSLAEGRADLQAFALERLGAPITEILGYPLGFGGEEHRPPSERILFVGDAAGMAEPLLGEGIHNAVKTGEIASHLIIDAVKTGALIRDRYDTALAPVRRDIHLCRRVAERVFYAKMSYLRAMGLTSPIVTRALVRGSAAGKTLDETRRLWPGIYLQRPVATPLALSA